MNSNMSKRSRWLWAFIFIALFLLSQDYLFTTWSTRTAWGGFPGWLGWFMFVHALFIAVFYFFANRHWK